MLIGCFSHRKGFAGKSCLAPGSKFLDSCLGLGVTKVTEVDYCAHPGWLTESLGATGNGFAEQITGGTREVDVFVVLTGRLTKIWFKDVMS